MSSPLVSTCSQPLINWLFVMSQELLSPRDAVEQLMDIAETCEPPVSPAELADLVRAFEEARNVKVPPELLEVWAVTGGIGDDLTAAIYGPKFALNLENDMICKYLDNEIYNDQTGEWTTAEHIYHQPKWWVTKNGIDFDPSKTIWVVEFCHNAYESDWNVWLICDPESAHCGQIAALTQIEGGHVLDCTMPELLDIFATEKLDVDAHEIAGLLVLDIIESLPKVAPIVTNYDD